MARKQRDPRDTYEVMEFFACGEGHFLTPGFTHWEEGEVCPHAHEPDVSNEDVHLYYRKLWVPVWRGTDAEPQSQENGTSLDYFRDNPGKWGHLPVVDPIDVLKEPLPMGKVQVKLPLAVIEHYTRLAHASHVSRQACLSQVLRAAMTNPAPHLPIEGYDPDREGGKAFDIHVRSVEIQREIDAGVR